MTLRVCVPLAGRRAVCWGSVAGSVLAPAGCQLAAALFPLAPQAATTRNPAAQHPHRWFPWEDASPGLPCPVYPCMMTHPWKNDRNEAVRERSVRKMMQNPASGDGIYPSLCVCVYICACVCICAPVHIHMSFPQWWYLFFHLFKIFSTTWNITLPVSGQLGFLSVCEKPMSFSVSVPFASALLFSFFLMLFHFIAFMDFCCASGISDCCWLCLQRAAFIWCKGNSVILALVNHCLPAVGRTWDAQGRPQPHPEQRGLRKISWPSFGGGISEGFAFLIHGGRFPPRISPPRAVPLALPAPWTSLGSAFVTPSEARPPSPNCPALGSEYRKPNTISAGLLGSKEKGYFKALLRSFFTPWVTAFG